MIVLGTALEAAALLLATPARALEVRGSMGRVAVGGFAEGYAIAPTDPAGHYQGPTGTLALTLTGDLLRKAHFFLDVRSTFGGPAQHPDGVGVINLSDTFQNVAPAIEFEEGYVEATLGNVDLRVGKQKFAWGKLDSFQPTDVLNPRRYTDPFVRTAEENKIGIPAARASYFLPPLGRGFQDVSATLIWVPVPVASRFPLEEERWFPSSTSVPPTTPVHLNKITIGQMEIDDPPEFVSHNHFTTSNRRPPQQLDEGAVGLRLAGLWKRADWALYYYDGPETLPSFRVDTRIRIVDLMKFGKCLGQDPGTKRHPCHIRAASVLRPTFGRIRLAGADMAVEWRGFTARAEGAWSSNRLLPSSVDELVAPEKLAAKVGPGVTNPLGKGKRVPIDLGDLSVARDTVEWGVGVDRSWHGWTPVLQMNQMFVLDNTTTLLVSDVDTRFLGVVRKAFLAERMPTEVGVLQSVARGYTAGFARVTYNLTDRLRARVGYVFIAGSRRSLVGQYHDNDEAFFQLRYSY